MTTTTDTDTEVAAKRAEWLDGLHRVFEFFVENPELIPPDGDGIRYRDATGGNASEERHRAGMWAKALGSCDKGYQDTLATIASKPGRFGPHTVGYIAMRSSVCTKTVTLVEKEVTEPDPELVADLPLVSRTVTEEVIEWDCAEPILAGQS